MFEEFKRTVEIDELCPIHHVKLLSLSMQVGNDEHKRTIPPFCPKCVEKKIASDNDTLQKMGQERELAQKTYKVFERESLIPGKLKEANFDNFIAETAEEKKLLNFAKSQANKYLQGMIGNTLISGNTGTGKSHLSLAIAKAINEGFKEDKNPKSVLFTSLTDIVSEIKHGWNYGKEAKRTEFEVIKLLSGVDFLILDDLGSRGKATDEASKWERELLFKILDKRQNTIINSNLSSDELKLALGEKNYSRILERLDGNAFKVFGIADKRYKLTELQKRIGR
ncbi:DNA replication protein DnaC [Streptococcus gallinaceus]|uniref:ATP-binding protein n=1 Tax=Streptococcus gallinaceus TaxID=165758 RepID=UPI0020A1FF7B|nr:ATP-binding protein [Streptococcus gallinaceus]MCP1639675.1 DNA replication protein DnaC [Streptococcus gallinaceus]MCP1770458.1 DNA replication protein DnaC [Streptococcus gallinaceus]